MTNPRMFSKRRAVALISGGLDSMLAARLIMDQGVHVEGLNFFTGFCVEGHTHAVRNSGRTRTQRNNALWVAEQLGIKLHIIDVIEEYKNVVMNPQHGYGTNLIPCLDCKSFMVRKALVWMETHDFDFIVTGEVIGQRPKSQRKSAMPVIASESGACDRLLRPLSAQALSPTRPELEGWVDRNKLYAITGRSRGKQMSLARAFGISDYAQPAGGCCFLTDASYSNKLRDLWQSRGERDYELDDIMLLKIGRHIRPKPNFKLIVARDEGETNFLRGYRKHFAYMFALGHSGPLVLLDGKLSPEDLSIAGGITARYCRGKSMSQVTVRHKPLNGEHMDMELKPLAPEEIPESWYL